MPALLTAQDCFGHVHLIIGSGSLAASRCAKSVDLGATPILICPQDEDVHFSLMRLLDENKMRWIQRDFEDEDLTGLGRQEVDGVVDAVFVTRGAKHPLSRRISGRCQRLRIPVNVVDAPQLCTFTLLSTYTDGPLQIGITTSGRGCKLAARIRREVASLLPPKFGDAVERLGTMRRRIWQEDQILAKASDELELDGEDEEPANQKHTFNTLVPENNIDPTIARMRRMRWLSQICEYWPLARLAAISDSDVSIILDAYKATVSATVATSTKESTTEAIRSEPRPQSPRGVITLAGSGPGHPSLLTIATHEAIQSAHYILADKLVPSEILALIPRRTPVHIARKFPGNAEAAQEELLNLSLTALREGKSVLRLKQGDPYLYGRGAEEVMFFRRHGYEARVIPGITSALSAPMFAGIPVTHRAIADQVVVCTGTGRKGAAPEPPAYQNGKTVIFLMALHRLPSLVRSLTCVFEEGDEAGKAAQVLWPRETPCAVIERASCPDQRVIRTTLAHVCQAAEEEGSRPPGLLVVGQACQVLHQPAEGQRWQTEEGFRSLDNVTASKQELRILDVLASQDTSPEAVKEELRVCNVQKEMNIPILI